MLYLHKIRGEGRGGQAGCWREGRFNIFLLLGVTAYVARSRRPHCANRLSVSPVAPPPSSSSLQQNKVGPDVSALESALAPIERYALRVRQEVDPFYSLYFRTEAQRREEVEAAGGDLDVDALEGASSIRIGLGMGSVRLGSVGFGWVRKGWGGAGLGWAGVGWAGLGSIGFTSGLWHKGDRMGRWQVCRCLFSVCLCVRLSFCFAVHPCVLIS